jgi:hypothetical protein
MVNISWACSIIEGWLSVYGKLTIDDPVTKPTNLFGPKVTAFRCLKSMLVKLSGNLTVTGSSLLQLTDESRRLATIGVLPGLLLNHLCTFARCFSDAKRLAPHSPLPGTFDLLG